MRPEALVLVFYSTTSIIIWPKGDMRRKKRFIQLGAVLLGSLALSGCLVGPDYTPPEVKVPEKWRLPDSALLVPGETDIRTWWEVFQDPMLTSLVNDAAASNQQP
jgi:hypothetical protein